MDSQFQAINATNNPEMDGYVLVKFSAYFNTLVSLYRSLTEKLDIQEIELLPDEEKKKYWNIAKRYYTDQPTAIKASKAAYVLDLITAKN